MVNVKKFQRKLSFINAYEAVLCGPKWSDWEALQNDDDEENELAIVREELLTGIY